MVLVAFLAVVLVTPMTAAIVYADAVRRGMSARERLARTLAVGVVSFCGFLLPHLFEGVLTRTYLRAVRSAPVVRSPYEVLAGHLAVGVAISVVSLLLYGVAVRRA